MVGLPIPASDNKDTLEEIVSATYISTDWFVDQWTPTGHKRVPSNLTSAQIQAIAESDWIMITLSSSANTDSDIYLMTNHIVPIKSLAKQYADSGHDACHLYLPVGTANIPTSGTNKFSKNGYLQFNLYSGSIANAGSWFFSIDEELVPNNLTIKIYRVNF